MIDCHTHLEQKAYDLDRDEVILRSENAGLKAIVTCCAHPDDIDVTIKMLEKYPNFIFATASIHPEYIERMNDEWWSRILALLKNPSVIGVGETGLDFKAVETEELRNRQVELFKRFIDIAEELSKPLVIHARGAFKETIDVLESNRAKRVAMHFFSAVDQLNRVINNNWYIMVNTTVCRSNNMEKIARDMPIERILLETDAPWLGLEGRRNEPIAIKEVAEKIAEVKKCSFPDVWDRCGKNAAQFFELVI
ncbi:MAG TPA: TatD family hydrolase [archaeon]|nr:TatD family hydrolase [archaeon]